jgi:glutamate 5-kinase
MGRKSSEIEGILGFRGRDELIHRDDLVIMGHENLQSAQASQ